METDNNNSTSGNGNRGKFSDRLKKIRRDRLKLRKGIQSEAEVVEENFLKRGARNVFKVFLALPSVVYGAVKSNNKDNSLKQNVDDDNKIDHTNVNNELFSNSIDQINVNRKIKVNKIREMDVALLQKQKEIYVKKQKEIYIQQQNEIYVQKQKTLDLENKEKENEIRNETIELERQSNVIDKEQRIIKLQREIIGLIKKKLVKNINELEVLQSELYLLREVNGDDIYLKKCQDDIKEIKKLLTKVKTLKEKYDYLKDNMDFEYMLEYGDDLLIDKILELKDLCSHEDIKFVVDNYKILDEYKFLYLKVDKLQEDTIKYDEYKKKKEKELKERDIDFDKLKNEVYDVSKENDRYDSFVSEQERFLRELDNKISKIDSREKVSFKLKGFNQLLGNSFKYLGLLLVNPLKGLIPGIATQTVVTRNLVHNLYNNLEWQEKREMVYEAVDYSMSLNVAMNNLDGTLSMVNSTLDDIVRLKNKYINEFSEYQSSFPSYRDAIKKINKIENAILGSKIKIELMQERMKEKEKQNSEKMRKVKKLNSSMNN